MSGGFLKHLCIALLVALHAAPAAALDRDPLDFPLRQYALLLSVALLGGFVSWYAKVRAGTAQAWNLMHLIGELATSAFAGLLAFWVCAAFDVPQLVTVALVGVAGHMGTRAIAAAELYAERWAKRRLNLPDNGGPT